MAAWEVRLILQHQIEAGRISQLGYSGRCEGENLGVTDSCEIGPGLGRDIRHTQTWPLTLVPRFELDEGETHVLPATGKTESRDGEHSCHRVLLIDQEVMLDLLDHLIGTHFGRA